MDRINNKGKGNKTSSANQGHVIPIGKIISK